MELYALERKDMCRHNHKGLFVVIFLLFGGHEEKQKIEKDVLLFRSFTS